jgi:cobalt-zinc-cadmium efflux system outer membrane protein
MIRNLVAAALILSSTGAAAQEVTVDQLVALALERSPALAAARSDIAVAEGERVQAALRPNPSVIGGNRRDVSGMDHEIEVGVEWPLDLFRRSSRIAVADQAITVASASIAERARMIAFAVREQAGRLLAARRTLAIRNEGVTAARRLRDLLEQRVTEGESPKLDANVAAVEALRAEAEAVSAAGDVEAEAIELKALVGLPPDAPLTLRGPLEALVRDGAAPSAQSNAAEVLARRTDIREAHARVSLAEARVGEARQSGRYDVMLSGGYGHMRFGFPQSGLDMAGRHVPIEDVFQTVTVGATVTWPFRNRNQGAVAAAEAAREGARATVTAREVRARAELDAAAVRDREARRAVELYASTIRELARQNVDAFLEAYDLGRYTLADVLGEQRRYLDVEGSYTAVLLRAYEARVDLMRARGESQ